jgi:hypothetical protein
MELYCDEPDCDRPVAGHGRGKCSTHLKQLQRTGKTAPIAEKLTPRERVLEAGDAWLNASDDDDEYDRAERAFILQAKNLGRAAVVEAIKVGLADARARGVRIGRPPKVTDEELLHAFTVANGSVTMTARFLRLAISSVYERLLRKGLLSERRGRPRMTG